MVRVRNTRPAEVAGLAPGEVGEVDNKNPGVAGFIEVGWLVDADKIEEPAREPTISEMRASLSGAREEIEQARQGFEKLSRENENLRAHVADANANALKFNGEMTEARSRAAELEAQNKHLAAVAVTNANELKRTHDANRELAARIAELEAQLAAKAESPTTAEPTSSPEAPAKKGKG